MKYQSTWVFLDYIFCIYGIYGKALKTHRKAKALGGSNE